MPDGSSTSSSSVREEVGDPCAWAEVFIGAKIVDKILIAKLKFTT
jgi:hypothetical protein